MASKSITHKARRAPRSRSATAIPRWLPVVVLVPVVAFVGWILLEEQGKAEDPAGVGSNGSLAAEAFETDQPEPAPLSDEGNIPILPGSGPLIVKLRYLGGRDDEPIVPRRAGSLEGRVLDSIGAGFRRARLEVVGGPQAGWTAYSDAEGRFRFPEILPGMHYFRISVSGRPTVVRQQRVLGLAATYRDFKLGADTAFQVKVVGEDGEAVEGARLSTDFGVVQATSDEEGLATLVGVPGGRVLLDIEADGFVPVRQERHFEGVQDLTTPLEVPALRKGGSVKGQVVSWPGGPLPTVAAVPQADRPGDHVIWSRWQNVPVDAEGRFELVDLPLTRTMTIRVFHPEGVSKPPQRSLRPDPHGTAHLKFVVQRGDDRVAGRVVDEAGEALSDVRLVLESEDPAAVLGQLYQGLADGPVATPLPVPAPLRRELTTGRDGRFDFAFGDHPKGSGALVLTATKGGYTSVRKTIRTAKSNLRVRMEPLTESGALRLKWLSNQPLPEQQYYLDGQEVERVDRLQPGRYELRIERGEHEILFRESLLILRPTDVVLG